MSKSKCSVCSKPFKHKKGETLIGRLGIIPVQFCKTHLKKILKILEWRSLDRSTKTIVKTYNEAKNLFAKTIKEHSATIAYAIDKNGRYANLNHLPEFKNEDRYVKSKTR